MAPRRLFLVLLPLTLAFRVWLAWALPITGDEAYFVEWGRQPDWGFYDHPPMIGWWLALLLRVGDAAAWLRLPAIVQPAILALAVSRALPLAAGGQDDRRWWLALLVLLAPIDVWNVAITTDTPLIYFCVLSMLAWLRAGRDDDARWYLVAGIMLAGAVLSKYFAALLGAAYLIDVLVVKRRAGAWRGLAITYACVLPALALMAWWNAGHCWTNYLFNFVNRHGGAGWSWRTPLLYLATLAYALTPPACLALLGAGRSPRALPSLIVLWAVPLAAFAALSLVKTIGLHWLLAFVPAALLWLAATLPVERLRKLALFFAGFAALHVAVIVAIAQLPLETWRSLRQYDGIVLTVDSRALLGRMRPYSADYVFASDGYSNAVTFGFNSQKQGGQRFIVLGPGSSHARHDDIQTDFRALDHGNIAVLRKTAPDADQYRRWFRDVTVQSFEQRGARFWIVLGRDFDYAAYRDDVLVPAARKWYAIPAWLPRTGCYFCERYSGGEACGSRR
jgi:4-amino-4-deoxy-L-arabinose transferase-like glycosyltransferase